MKKSLLGILIMMITSLNTSAQWVSEGEVVCIYFTARNQTMGKLCDAYQQLSEFYEYRLYSEQVLDDVQNNREPSEPPSKLRGGKTLYAQMKQVRNSLENATFPSYIQPSISYPTLDQLNSSDNSMKRSALKSATDYLLQYQKELEEMKKVKADLEKFNNDIRLVKEAVNELSHDFEEIFVNSGGGLHWLSSTFGFAVLDMETKLKPELNKSASALKRQISDLEALITSEETKLANLQANTLLMLEAEESDLTNQKTEVETKITQLQNESEVFVERSNKNDQLREKLKIDQNRLAEQISGLQNEESQLNAEIDRYNASIKKLLQKERKINNFKYTYCPNQNSFDGCSHNQQKNRYINQRNSMVKDYNDYAQKVAKRKTAVERRNANLERDLEKWMRASRVFEQELEQWTKENDALLEFQDRVIEELKSSFTKGFELDELLETNAEDQSRAASYLDSLM